MTLNGFRLLCPFLCLLLVGQSRASTVEHLNLEQLTGRADQVYLATVIEPPASVWHSDAPATRLRLRLSRILKADDSRLAPADTIEVFLPGGTVDGIRQQIVGMPQFTQDEGTVLFLSAPDAAGRRWPIGLAQAKFRVERRAGRPARVSQALVGLHRVTPGAARRPGVGAEPAAAMTDGELTLDELIRQVEAHVGEASRGGHD